MEVYILIGMSHSRARNSRKSERKKNIKNLFLLSLTEDVWDKRSVCFLVIMHGGVFSLYGGKKNGNVDASLRRIIIMSKLSKAHTTP